MEVVSYGWGEEVLLQCLNQEVQLAAPELSQGVQAQTLRTKEKGTRDEWRSLSIVTTFLIGGEEEKTCLSFQGQKCQCPHQMVIVHQNVLRWWKMGTDENQW